MGQITEKAKLNHRSGHIRFSAFLCAFLLTLIVIATVGISSTNSDASAKKIKLNKKTVTLKVGQSVKLKVKNTKKKVKWSSGKKKVATVTSKGKVKAKKKGTAKIYAKVAGKKLVCKVKVKAVTTKPTATQTPSATETSSVTEPISTEVPSVTQRPVQTAEPVETQIPGVTYTFRYPSYLTEHFEKHGAEVGASTEEEYLIKANEVISNPDALHKLEAEDNDHVYYIENTNEIVFLSQDGYIRTYFICSGIEYYNKQ